MKFLKEFKLFESRPTFTIGSTSGYTDDELYEELWNEIGDALDNEFGQSGPYPASPAKLKKENDIHDKFDFDGESYYQYPPTHKKSGKEFTTDELKKLREYLVDIGIIFEEE